MTGDLLGRRGVKRREFAWGRLHRMQPEWPPH
jgi:hypothetical protein